ncbi:hypothetical protein ACJW30_05G166900 [Castanea mollissima]
MARDLENGKEERFAGLKKPYLAALRGDWDDMKRFFDNNPEHLLAPLTIDKDTAFHIAAYSEEKELLQHLVQLLPASFSLFEALNKKNKHGNNTFHELASTDEVETAEFLVKKLRAASGADEIRGSRLKELLEERTQLGETPLYRAAAFGQTKMAKFLAKQIGDSNLRYHFHRDDQVSILHIAVIGQHFDTAIWLLGKEKELAKKLETNNLTCLHLLAKMPSAFRSSSHIGILKKILCYWLPSQMEDKDSNDDVDNGCDHKTFSQNISNTYRALWRNIAEVSKVIKELWKMKIKHALASRLTDLLVEADSTWDETHKYKVAEKTISLGDIDEEVKLNTGKEKVSLTIEVAGDGKIQTKPNERKYVTLNEIRTPLLAAASEGIVEIFDKIIQVHPQAIEHLDKDEENILHVAVAHRQKEIFDRLELMMKIRNCRLVSRININGYTLLHQAADMKYYQGDVAGPCFQLQEELNWLERVREIIPSHYVMHRNNASNTADELFKDQHAELLKRAQKWIKETSQSCSAVSVLVASLVYTAAYQPPGDLESERNTVAFKLFTIMDVIALAFSLTSVVTFLSILSSPFEYEDFRKSLPRKLAVGFTLLFISVITTMISFGATIFLVIHFGKKAWTNTLIYSAAFFPVSVFALTQFPLYSSFLRTLQTSFKKIVMVVNPQKLIPRYLRTCKSKTY